MNLKLAAVFLTVMLIANLILFALRRISDMTFWIVIIAIGAIAYFIMPRLKKAQNKQKTFK